MINLAQKNCPISRWKWVLFPEKQFVSRRNGSFFREIGQFSGKQDHCYQEKVHFQLELNHSSGKSAKFPGNKIIHPGNKFISRKTASYFRKNGLFRGEDYFFPGNWVISRRTASVFREKESLPVGIIHFPLEIGLFSGKQHHSSGKQAYFPENSSIFPEKWYVTRWQLLISVGIGATSRKTVSFFRETDRENQRMGSLFPEKRPVSTSKVVL